MNGQPVDRLPCWEPLGFAAATLDRWHDEGLPYDVVLDQFFQWDHCEAVPVSLAAIPSGHDIPLPVETEEHLRALFPYYCWHAPARYPYRWEALKRWWAGREFVLGLGRAPAPGAGAAGVVKGFTAWLLEWLGPAAAREAGDGGLASVALEWLAEYVRLTIARAAAEVELDFALLTDDLCPGGEALTPAQFEALAPAYARLAGWLREHGVPHVVLYSPGNMTGLVPHLLEIGIDGIMPCEAAAGMDPLALAEAYPALRIIGGMDVRQLAKQKRDADRETRRKVPVALERGRWIPCFDRSIPPTVPLANYERYWYVRQELTGSGDFEGRSAE